MTNLDPVRTQVAWAENRDSVESGQPGYNYHYLFSHPPVVVFVVVFGVELRREIQSHQRF